jgi:ankyrin repeat protein
MVYAPSFRSLGIAVALAVQGCGAPDLYSAIRSGDRQAVVQALEAGADVQTADAYGITPLMAAVRANRPDIAELLIDRGARVRAADRRGFTALHYAAQNGMTRTAGLLLDRGAAVDAPAGTGRYTPLQLAVIASHDGTAVLLVERGAEVTRRNAQGVDARDIATSRSEFDLAAALEEAAARR